MKQTVFEFISEAMTISRSGVMSLCVFRMDGEKAKVSYERWLKWFSPLSHTINDEVGR